MRLSISPSLPVASLARIERNVGLIEHFGVFRKCGGKIVPRLDAAFELAQHFPQRRVLLLLDNAPQHTEIVMPVSTMIAN